MMSEGLVLPMCPLLTPSAYNLSQTAERRYASEVSSQAEVVKLIQTLRLPFP